MMVKNEEELLPRALQSMSDYVDEIVVVDTGSTDGTIEIAESFGAKIYHHPWEGDFSKHRNQTLQYATGDWIFILDADEEMKEGDGPGLRRLINESPENVSHILFRVLNCCPGTRNVTNETHSIRVFRNGMGFHYKSIVHNEIQTPGGEPFVSSLTLWHYGYNLTREKMKIKFQRRVDLLNKQLEENPGNPFTLFNLANAWFDEDPKKTLKHGYDLIDYLEKENTFDVVYINVFYPIMATYMNLSRFDEALNAGEKALRFYEHYVDAYYILCDASLRTGRHMDVIRYGEGYLRVRDYYLLHRKELKHMWAHTLEKTDDVLFGMGIAHAALGNSEKARILLDDAVQQKGKSEKLWEHLLNSLEIASSCRTGIDLKEYYIARALSDYPDNTEILRLAYAIEKKAKKTHEALAYLKMIQRIDKAPGWKINEAEILIEQEDYAAALKAVETVFAETTDDWRSNLILMKLSIVMNRIEDSIMYLDIALKLMGKAITTEISSLDEYAEILFRASETLYEKKEPFYAEMILSCQDFLRCH